MENQRQERRKFRRVYFTEEDNIHALITFPGTQEKPVQAGVMNLSEEGICLTYKKNDAAEVCKNDVLILRQLTGLTPDPFQEELKIEVRWVMNEAFFNHNQIGCQIINATESFRKLARHADLHGVIK